MSLEAFVMGVDYGTDSVRSVIVNSRNGQEIASSVYYYPRWRDGLFCDSGRNQFRQHPLDYIEGLESTIRECIREAGLASQRAIRAISVDTTGSTPVAVNRSGKPLALCPGFESNPNAMFILWKDHTATREAAEINAHVRDFPVNYLKYVGGIYSSEWFWAKLLHILRSDEYVHKECYSWVEHCDWIPFLLTGGENVQQMKRGVCSAGHKALWAPEFGGLPPDNFFSSLDPLLKGFTDRLFQETFTADRPAGKLSREWADRLGLTTDVVVGIGAFDAHMGAVGGQIEPYHLSKVMGTSTCDMLVVPKGDFGGKLIKGICGQVEGSIIPGMIGLEAGQSAFGDTYAWFRQVFLRPVQTLLSQSSIVDSSIARKLIDGISAEFIPEISRQAAAIPLDLSDPVAVDWLNGRRTPDANQELKGAMFDLNLATSAPQLFKAWVEATCFGAKAIVERFVKEQVPVKGLIGLGGVAGKSPYIMQVMADVMDMPIRIHRSEQTCAIGAAMFAATAAGLYDNIEDAMANMGQGFDKTYFPDRSKTDLYAARYKKYLRAGSLVEKLKNENIVGHQFV